MCSWMPLKQKVTLVHAHEANQRIVDQLNDQVDFLNRQLAVREEQLSKKVIRPFFFRWGHRLVRLPGLVGWLIVGVVSLSLSGLLGWSDGWMVCCLIYWFIDLWIRSWVGWVLYCLVLWLFDCFIIWLFGKRIWSQTGYFLNWFVDWMVGDWFG